MSKKYKLYQKALYGDVEVFDEGTYLDSTDSFFFYVGVDQDNIPITGYIKKGENVFLHSLEFCKDTGTYLVEYKGDSKDD